MKKPAIFIDAFLSDESRHEIFNHNVSNFVKNDWDVFIISNKIHHFGMFNGIKYFEYDSTNRILSDRNRYGLTSGMNWKLYLNDGVNNLLFSGTNHTHGFTNWSLLYNLRRIAEVMQRYGHTHFITSEYDNKFKTYDLMNTLFKDFGTTENSKKCMIVPGNGWKCTTSLYLISVETVLNTIPVLNTEDDYENFMRHFYGGYAISPVYEELFSNMFVHYVGDTPTTAELIPLSTYHEYVDGFGAYMSNGSTALRHGIGHTGTLLVPINDNKEFFIHNGNGYPIMINFTTNNFTTQFTLEHGSWRKFMVDTFVTVTTSDMLKTNESMTFDLVNGPKYDFTLKPI